MTNLSIDELNDLAAALVPEALQNIDDEETIAAILKVDLDVARRVQAQFRGLNASVTFPNYAVFDEYAEVEDVYDDFDDEPLHYDCPWCGTDGGYDFGDDEDDES